MGSELKIRWNYTCSAKVYSGVQPFIGYDKELVQNF